MCFLRRSQKLIKSSPFIWHLLKLSQNKKDPNDVTAALFSVGFFAAGSWEKDTKNGAAVTSLRSFLFRDNFRKWKRRIPTKKFVFWFRILLKYLKNSVFNCIFQQEEKADEQVIIQNSYQTSLRYQIRNNNDFV